MNEYNFRHKMELKPCRWVGSAKKDLQHFPAKVKEHIGTALMYAQAGSKVGCAKPLKGFGTGVLEIVDDHDGDTYRCVYLLRLKGCVYVLHAFQKKSKKGIKTPTQDIVLIRSRIKLAQEDYEKRPTE
ncbi:MULTISPECIES: type II toxin-antitoxin system RelE/ParE family toxin [unclassified Yoonia]|uniref:type II toxin-antitoxin system RelE/ParE family toxin n=1 Tax=unclassified Yoonia TaxID=2629118 RepID=UPI002B003ACF|nr:MULTISPECIES: type II toxin-antitoxin system RelE/ParE family toxin [unclassified Yoonia]